MPSLSRLAVLHVLAAAPAASGSTVNQYHYGDPDTGCQSDEQAISVPGISGDFCSKQCDGNMCPHDQPLGMSAQVSCALQTSTTAEQYCALICFTDDIKVHGSSDECGQALCQPYSALAPGYGICLYPAKKLPAALAHMVPNVRESVLQSASGISSKAVNPTHYGDPKTGCEKDEQKLNVEGITGDFCSPACNKDGFCPSDMPSGDTATPTCALQSPSGNRYCALICKPSELQSNGADGECGTGSCQSIQGTGICTYASTNSSLPTASLVSMVRSGSSVVV